MSTTDLDSPMAMAYRINKTFDPWSQDIMVTLPDGITTYVANYADIVAVQRSVMIQSVSQGIQVGASFILLVILLLITTRDKRRSIVFILNALALFLVIFRGVFAMFTFAGPFYDFYRWLLYYYSDTRTAQHISCVGEVATFILTVCIELSLVMQVRIVCCNLEDWRRHGITVLNVFAAFVACGIRFALMVVNITWGIVGVESTTYRQSQLISRLASAANITFVISIGISAVIFCTKLAFAIQSRRSMGMKQFGPMQIIFVMGCQTMCTPLIFTIICYWVIPNAQMGTFVPVVVAITLPLSAMWAAVNANQLHVANSNSRNALRHQVPLGAPDHVRGKEHGSGYDTANTTSTLVDDDDVEMQKMGVGGGVEVHRTYSVRSD
ncbi:pheromone alpha factor receptor [Vermiconidia calcicola]|uniref:Pheromone alpha factor receptor n=1 Tax=Vermiconidia calcicola TaxID=1690605 RepID=A0ACC3MEG5_9PEZI|nr:pheromone alpha factor receptor [Vermiconidia calcicola]